MATKKTAKKRTSPPSGNGETIIIEGVAETVGASVDGSAPKQKSSPSQKATSSATAPKQSPHRIRNLAIALALIFGAAGTALGGYSYMQMQGLVASEMRAAEITASAQEIAEENIAALRKLRADVSDLREIQTKLAEEIAALQEMPQADDRISGLVLSITQLEAKLEAMATAQAPARTPEINTIDLAPLHQEIASLRAMIMAKENASIPAADDETLPDQSPSQAEDGASWWDKLMGAISFTRLDGGP